MQRSGYQAGEARCSGLGCGQFTLEEAPEGRGASSMTIKIGKHVDANGKMYLPYLHEWEHPSQTCWGLFKS